MRPSLGLKKLCFSCLQGSGILIITLAVYFLALHFGYEAQEVRAMAFVTLIVSNIAIILTNRSWTDNIFRIIITPKQSGIMGNWWGIFFSGTDIKCTLLSEFIPVPQTFMDQYRNLQFSRNNKHSLVRNI